MNTFLRLILFYFLFTTFNLPFTTTAQEFNSGWLCAPVKSVNAQGEQISQPDFSLQKWQPAVVPGTVLTTMLSNKQVPDPFYGMNNEKIKDIYETGAEHYTYWFVKDFDAKKSTVNGQFFLKLRGVNYSCDVFLNGKKLNQKRHYGMFLRQKYNVTSTLKNGKNRLAVIVYPPDPVGNPNGGQGGDGTIAKNVSHQYVAGWDWIQPMRDRNTGIWDKVTLEQTGAVDISDPHVVTLVPGQRKVAGKQAPAIVKVSVKADNPTASAVSGTLKFEMAGKTYTKTVSLKSRASEEISFADITVTDPKLWWPNTYGEAYLYPANIRFILSGKISDEEKLNIGIRQVQTSWNSRTRSREIAVNGQKVFIKGGNWIISDAMLRLSKERYDTEIRFHRDMNLNLIRVWGGALTERPEFYEACDQYGLLVMQDFWGSGDCNGRWLDPMKKDDQWTRRKYPDDHDLFLASAEDMIKMIRNHASLAMWCGGNEITLPQDILTPLRDKLLPKLDGTRWFIDYSNSDEMSYNDLGGNGDGPYGIQPINRFWEYKTWPFNSEIGSVGLGDMESLERFMPKENLVVPAVKSMEKTGDAVWNYHKYISYENSIEPYGKPKDLNDFTEKAQLVNYDQYRQMLEGFSAHMWDWYTGIIIWKTQNPWTAMRGQMYDYYLDPNACLYGLRKGSEPLHAMYNPVENIVMVVNNSFETVRDMMLEVHYYNMDGRDSMLTQVFVEVSPSRAKKILAVKQAVEFSKKEGGFLVLKLRDVNKNLLTQNIYWLADEKGEYSGLQKMKKTEMQVSLKPVSAGKIEVTLSNPANAPLAFFNRISILDPQTKKRILPTFYSDNYVSVLPGEKETITIDYPAGKAKPIVEVRGWNTGKQQMAAP